MGIFTIKSVYAWHRHGPDRVDDCAKAQTILRHRRTRRVGASLISGLTSGLIFNLLTALLTSTAQADPIRIATYNAELSRRGPGLLLRDILSGKDKQVQAVTGIIAHISPDILLINSFDYDLGNVALNAFADLLADHTKPYPYRFALLPNTGMPTGLDMDGDGRTGDPRDAQGYGRFSGQGGMAILSRHPINTEMVRDFSALKWVDFPNAMLPTMDGKPFPSPQAQAEQRLSTTGHWVVPVTTPNGIINLMVFHATPPVFDGAEDRNGKRNHDEVRFWASYLDGELNGVLATKPDTAAFVILGDANLDPNDGDGRSIAMQQLLAHPMLQDPHPKSRGAVHASTSQAGGNIGQISDPAQDTADWKDGGENSGENGDGPGNMRVDYVLPSRALTVVGTGVFWPAPDSPDAAMLSVGDTLASRHHLVWVDVIPQR